MQPVYVGVFFAEARDDAASGLPTAGRTLATAAA
jgi:hypothetical protein